MSTTFLPEKNKYLLTLSLIFLVKTRSLIEVILTDVLLQANETFALQLELNIYFYKQKMKCHSDNIFTIDWSEFHSFWMRFHSKKENILYSREYLIYWPIYWLNHLSIYYVSIFSLLEKPLCVDLKGSRSICLAFWSLEGWRDAMGKF